MITNINEFKNHLNENHNDDLASEEEKLSWSDEEDGYDNYLDSIHSRLEITEEEYERLHPDISFDKIIEIEADKGFDDYNSTEPALVVQAILNPTNESKNINENIYSMIGYTVPVQDKIFISIEAENKFGKNEFGNLVFEAKNHICKVIPYTYRNRPNKFVYISIRMKTDRDNAAIIESLDEATKLAQDINECIAFINTLERV